MKSFLFKNLCKAFTLTITAVLCLFILVGCGNDDAKDVISEGVTVSGVELGGLTKSEAKKALASDAGFADDIVLEFECEGAEFSIPASQIELKADIDKSVEKAYAVGRGKDADKNKKDKKKAKKEGYPLNMALSYNKDKFVLVTSDFVGDKLIDPSPMMVEIGSDCLIVTNAIGGIVVDTDKFTNDLEKELADFKQDKKIVLALNPFKR